MEKEKAQKINIEIDGEISQGKYANFVVLTHSPAEFVIDFTRLLPGVPKAKIHSRVIMAPLHAKAFLKALQENIDRFEGKYGEIRLNVKDAFTELGVEPPTNKTSN